MGGCCYKCTAKEYEHELVRGLQTLERLGISSSWVVTFSLSVSQAPSFSIWFSPLFHQVPPPERLPPLKTPQFTPPSSFSKQESEEWSKDIKATFLGHACFLIEFPKLPEQERGLRVLFDPVWSHRCSPSQCQLCFFFFFPFFFPHWAQLFSLFPFCWMNWPSPFQTNQWLDLQELLSHLSS